MLNYKCTNKRMASLKLKSKNKHFRNLGLRQKQQHPQYLSLANDSFLHSSLKNSARKTQNENRAINKLRNSLSTVDENKHSKANNPQKTNLSATKLGIKKQDRSPEFLSTKKPKRDFLVKRQVYQKYNEERVQTLKTKKLRNDLVQNALDLFKLSQDSLKQREVILGQLKQELNLSWKKLCEMLSGSNNSCAQIVQTAFGTLVKQRRFIEEQKQKMERILQNLKI